MQGARRGGRGSDDLDDSSKATTDSSRTSSSQFDTS